MYNKYFLKGGDISQDIISFIRDTRTKYQLKQELNLYIDLINDFKPLDIIVCGYESVLVKMGNLNKVEYTLHTLLENGSYFSAKNISGYNVYIELPGIEVDMNYEDEISRLTKQRESINNKLNNNTFLSKAPIDVIDGERNKLDYIDNKIQSLINIKLLLLNGIEYYDLIYNIGFKWVFYYIQELRTKNTDIIKYSQEWFNYVYSKNITSDEITSLYKKTPLI
jgi:valyl-tRNA synthetase